jgi:hypothetical protein
VRLTNNGRREQVAVLPSINGRCREGVMSESESKKVVDHDDPIVIRRVALAALCDPRTVRRYFRGEKLRPLVAIRIEKAVQETAS